MKNSVNKKKGFSLLELMMTVAIIGVLTAVIYPTYVSYVRKGYRAEAVASLTGISLAEEQWRATHTSYGTLANVWGAVTTTASGRYTLAVSAVSASGYTVTATATGDQANDANGAQSCASLVLTTSNTVTTTTPTVCWS